MNKNHNFPLSPQYKTKNKAEEEGEEDDRNFQKIK